MAERDADFQPAGEVAKVVTVRVLQYRQFEPARANAPYWDDGKWGAWQDVKLGEETR